MKEELTNRKRTILIPILAGSAVGAGLALLLAPKSGSETRKDLKRLGNRLSQAVDIGKDLYGEGKVFVNKAVEAGKKAYEEEKPLEPLSNEGRSLLVPILASSIIGAGIALLLAPKAGRETREDLKRLASNTRESAVSALDKGKHLYETGKGAVAGAMEAGKKLYAEGKEKLGHAA
jgi:gas vesicle protein